MGNDIRGKGVFFKVYIDTTFRPAYIPTCATGCSYCGGFLPFYKNFRAIYKNGVWRIKEGSGVDGRCGNGKSCAVLIGVYKKVFLRTADTVFFNAGMGK